MKARYRLIHRGNRIAAFYLVDTQTGKRTSLHTSDKDAAQQLVDAKNQAERQPALNRQLAKAYLSGADSGAATRTWRDAIEALTNSKPGKANRERWRRVANDKALAPLWPMVIIDTQGEFLLKVIQSGKVSTNIYLRRLHNFCVDMSWLSWPLIPKRQWPAIRFKTKRAITLEEHCKIVERERNPERKAYYQLAWHLGASQGDLAHLEAEDVDQTAQIISYTRMKTAWRGQQPPQIRFGDEVKAILATLPKSGPLFPYLRNVQPGHRATEFRQRCLGLGIRGVTLHSYRYAWAERAKVVGYPERYAQLALGHNSKAVSRAYARNAQVTLPPLEEFEKRMAEKIVRLPLEAAV